MAGSTRTHADSIRVLAARLGLSETRVAEALSMEGLTLEPELVRARSSARVTWPRRLSPPSHRNRAPNTRGTGMGALLGDRYRDLGPLGGGDGRGPAGLRPPLRRVVAMKTLRSRLLENPAVISRFIEEAEVTAQLQHPGIIPIHDRGVLPDGRVWFTMREIDGRSYFEAIRDHHRTSGSSLEDILRSRRRLIEALRRVCAAVAPAHERGVVHRDLKPENIMVGSSGEILVVDWACTRWSQRQ